MKKRIALWNFNYMPAWEAASKEVEALLNGYDDEFDLSLVAMNTRRRRFTLSGREKHLPFPWALVFVPFCRPYAGRFDVNHIYASLSENRLMSFIKGPKTILTASKDHASEESVERNLANLKTIPFIVVESEAHRTLLEQFELPREKIKLIYPGKDVKPHVAAEGPFKILFATSPRRIEDFETRGVNLMLDVAQRLPEVQFILVWRDLFLNEIQEEIRTQGLKNVEVRNGIIPDMGALYDSVHAVILPGVTSNSIKPCPHSALDGLAHGKPVLCSKPMSISPIIEERRCGQVFDPDPEALLEAIEALQNDYETYQANCHSVIEDTFSTQTFLDKYRAIYRAL